MRPIGTSAENGGHVQNSTVPTAAQSAESGPVPESMTDTGPRRPPVRRPAPGPRRPREIWTGRSELWLSEVTSDPSQPMRNVEGRGLRGANKLNPDVLERHRRRTKGRIVGIDAARGFALLGMFAVHILPALAPSGERATVTWMLLGGNAASLFAVLAGASLSFSSGGQAPFTGSALRHSRMLITIRALLLIIIGMSINLLDLTVYNILVYFGMMFLLVLPFLGRGPRTLIALGAGMLILMPILRYILHREIDFLGYYANPTFVDLVHDPFGVIGSLTVYGVYPALTWIALIILGMGIGRLPLHHSSPRVTVAAVGGFSAIVASAASYVIINRLGGYGLVWDSMADFSEDEVDDFIVFGPDGQLPVDSAGWLLSNGPHTDTPFALVTGAGFALACIGVFVMISRWQAILSPLIDVGAMSMSIYVLHLIVMKYAPEEIGLLPLFLIQVVIALFFASLWRMFFARGPIEAVMTSVAKGIGSIFFARAERRDRDRAQFARAQIID